MKKILAFLLAVVMLLSFAACGGGNAATDDKADDSSATNTDDANKDSDEAGGDSVNIGVLLPMSGDAAVMGEKQKAAIEMFFEDYNEAGGIESMGGAKVNLIFADTTGKAEVGVTEMERLINQENVCAIIGPYNSAVGSATAPIAEKNQMPYLVLSSVADTILQNGYKYVFRANSCTSDIISTMKAFIEDYRGTDGFDPKTYGIIYENTDYGKENHEKLAAMVEELGGEIVVDETYEANTSDMSSIVNKIKAAEPDIVFPVCYLNDSLLFTQQLAEYKVNTTLFGTGGGLAVSDYITNAGANSEYVITNAGWSTGILDYKPEEATAINEEYTERTGLPLDEYGAFGYFNAAVMANVLERAASTDKEAIREAFLNTDIKADDPELLLMPYEGVKFGERDGMTNQNIYSCNIVTQVLDGEFTLVAPYSLVGDESPVVLSIPTWDAR